VGVARAGTTSLASWLAQHPELQMSTIKETNYFARPDLGTSGPGDHWLNTPPEFDADGVMRGAHFARIETEREYLECFTPTKPGARWRGEASVSYAFYTRAAARLAEANPKCKIVFVLRDPVMRAISNYSLFRMLGIETLTMDAALDAEDRRIAEGYQFCWAYAGLSRYRRAIGRYVNCFPVEQIHVAKFEDLMENREPEAWRQLLVFLGVDDEFEPIAHHYNDTKAEQATNPVDETVRVRLRNELTAETAFYERIFASESPKRSELLLLRNAVA
jgi:Sulfotransferase family